MTYSVVTCPVCGKRYPSSWREEILQVVHTGDPDGRHSVTRNDNGPLGFRRVLCAILGVRIQADGSFVSRDGEYQEPEFVLIGKMMILVFGLICLLGGLICLLGSLLLWGSVFPPR